MSQLTIVMYHYVRDLRNSRFPQIKARDIVEFKNQLKYIARNFTVVTVEQIIAAIRGLDTLPQNALWLTFDDGYLDHYTNVFPLLNEYGWQGSFFPTAATARDKIMLDVNKIHFILASQPDVKAILARTNQYIGDRAGSDGVREPRYYWNQYGKPSRYDTADVVYLKRVFQHALPDNVRRAILNQLFADYVSSDQSSFASELYATTDQLRTMVRCGMYVGSHGGGHYWLDKLTPEQKIQDINQSLDFLRFIGAPTDDWIMCYPYGAYNDDLLETLRDRRCVAGVSTTVGIAQIGHDNPLTLPRVNTNDLPFD